MSTASYAVKAERCHCGALPSIEIGHRGDAFAFCASCLENDPSAYYRGPFPSQAIVEWNHAVDEVRSEA